MHRNVWIFAAFLAGCPNPAGFGLLGSAHYEGKVFREVVGQFEAIAVAPVGGKVAFRGRENVDHHDLFLADLDGQIHKLADTGPSEGLITWSADGQVLYYFDAVPRADGLFDGATIQRYALSTQTFQQALYAVPLLSFLPSPDGSRLLVGGKTNPQNNAAPGTQANQLLDPATGQLKVVAPDRPRIAGTWAASWAPDGAHLALATQSTQIINGPSAISIVSSADGNAAPATERTFTGTYTALAWEDAGVLRVADIVVGDDLVLTRLDAEGKQLDESKVPLDSPPAGTRYVYDRPLPSRDGRKLLISRRSNDIKTGNWFGNRAFFLYKEGALQPLPTSEDLEAMGWSDDRHVVCLSGFYQNRKPVILDVE